MRLLVDLSKNAICTQLWTSCPFLNDFLAFFPKTYYKFTVCFAKLELFISNFSTLIKKWWGRAPFALNDEPPLLIAKKNT